MRKKGIIISAIVIAVIIIAIALNAGHKEIIIGEKNIDKAIASALFTAERGMYTAGECRTEGHIILGKEKSDKETLVYTLAMYAEYAFQDNNFVKTSESDVLPTVVKLTGNNSGYILGLSEVKWPDNTSDRVESLKSMFPEKYHDRVLNVKEEDIEKLKEQQLKGAQNYLNRIGREAKIGEYKDFEHPLIITQGVSIDISNKLVTKEYASYPHWIGTEEKIEDGVRYVYERIFNKERNEVIFKKYNYETKAVVEEIKVDTITGEEKERQTFNVTTSGTKKIGYISDFNKSSGKFTFDEVEWITLENQERLEELKINPDINMPNGYYLYNPEKEETTLKVNDNTIYDVINWNYKFSGETRYLTNERKEFDEYLDAYSKISPLFIVEYDKDGNIKSIAEKYVP